MTGKPTRFHKSIPWLVLAAGLALRLLVAPRGAHPGDFATLTGWAESLRSHSLLDIYQLTDANYPPAAVLLLAASRWVYSLIISAELAGPLWAILLKLPAILADLGIGWLVWRASERGSHALWLLALVVFNPALIYLSAWWGQYESPYMLAVLAALIAAREEQNFWAGLWLGLGMMIKLQATVIAPLLLIMVLRQLDRTSLNRLAAFCGGLVLALAVCLGPYAVTGQLAFVALRLVALVSGPGWPTVNALNLWYLWTGGQGNWRFNAPMTLPDSTLVAPGLSMHDLGLILLAVWTAVVIALAWWKIRRAPEASVYLALWAGVLMYLGVFLWPTQSHERYAFGAVVLALGAAAIAARSGRHPRPSLLAAILITGFHTLNLLWAAPFAPWLEGWFSANPIFGVGITAGFLIVTAWMLARLARRPGI